jgi:hypothetical protein
MILEVVVDLKCDSLDFVVTCRPQKRERREVK